MRDGDDPFADAARERGPVVGGARQVGLGDQEILHIAKRTVDEHTQKAIRKLGAANRTQAVAIALRERLIRKSSSSST